MEIVAMFFNWGKMMNFPSPPTYLPPELGIQEPFVDMRHPVNEMSGLTLAPTTTIKTTFNDVL